MAKEPCWRIAYEETDATARVQRGHFYGPADRSRKNGLPQMLRSFRQSAQYRTCLIVGVALVYMYQDASRDQVVREVPAEEWRNWQNPEVRHDRDGAGEFARRRD